MENLRNRLVRARVRGAILAMLLGACLATTAARRQPPRGPEDRAGSDGRHHGRLFLPQLAGPEPGRSDHERHPGAGAELRPELLQPRRGRSVRDAPRRRPRRRDRHRLRVPLRDRDSRPVRRPAGGVCRASTACPDCLRASAPSTARARRAWAFGRATPSGRSAGSGGATSDSRRCSPCRPTSVREPSRTTRPSRPGNLRPEQRRPRIRGTAGRDVLHRPRRDLRHAQPAPQPARPDGCRGRQRRRQSVRRRHVLGLQRHHDRSRDPHLRHHGRSQRGHRDVRLHEPRAEPAPLGRRRDGVRLGRLRAGGPPGQSAGQRADHRHGSEGPLEREGSERRVAIPRLLPDPAAGGGPEPRLRASGSADAAQRSRRRAPQVSRPGSEPAARAGIPAPSCCA